MTAKYNIILDNQEELSKLVDLVAENPKVPQTQIDWKQYQYFNGSYWKEVKAQVLEAIKEHQYAVIKNLPFDDTNQLFISFMNLLGNPIVTYTHKVERIVRDVSPLKGKVLDPALCHTDSTFWPEPNDLTALFCVCPDPEGNGKSRIVPVDLLLQELIAKGENLQNLMSIKYPFVLDSRFGDEGYFLKPIIESGQRFSEDSYLIRYNLSDTNSCLERFNLKLTNQQKATLDLINKTASDISERSEFLLEKGDILIFDNKRSLHARTPCNANSKRLVRMMKANLD
jgi:hypothetical protein